MIELERRVEAITQEAGASLWRIVSIALGASGVAGAGGFAAGRRSSSSGGRRDSDPLERPRSGADRDRAGELP